MSNVFLKPACDAEGNPLLVRDPASLIPLAAGGEWKRVSDYWVRRLSDREVIDATPSGAVLAAPPVAGVLDAGSSLLNLIRPPA